MSLVLRILKTFACSSTTSPSSQPQVSSDLHWFNAFTTRFTTVHVVLFAMAWASIISQTDPPAKEHKAVAS